MPSILTLEFIIAYLFWDPSPICFRIPLLDRPIMWYGVLFALGFFIGFCVLKLLFTYFFALRPEIAKDDIEDISLLQKSLKTQFPASKLDGNCATSLSTELNLVVIEPTSLGFSPKWIYQLFSKFFSKEEKASLLRRLFLEKNVYGLTTLASKSQVLAEKITFYVMIGAVIGARLGHMLFYEAPSYYLTNPSVIFRVWEGGLASHGGVIGILVSVLIFVLKQRKKFPSMSFLRIIDFAVIPTALAGAFIRFGNFVNQEILGVGSKLPWAIVFGHPADGSTQIARHPVQIYAVVFYLVTFLFLVHLFVRKKVFRKKGLLTGMFFVLVFSFRFVLEFIKESQSELVAQNSLLNMGQILSIPVVIVGIGLLIRNRTKALNSSAEM